jgi:hypothetical protein
MFLGLLPVTEIIIFIGMIASWFYLSIGIIGLKTEKTEATDFNHISLDCLSQQNGIDNNNLLYNCNIIDYSNLTAIETNECKLKIPTLHVCLSVNPVKPYHHLVTFSKEGRAPPVI